jgi:hypothetical protein
MRKYLLVLVLCVGVAGCTWEQAEKNADKIADGTDRIGAGNKALLPFTKEIGLAVGGILIGIGGIARSVSAFAKGRRIAKAAVAAAETVAGGGVAMANAASLPLLNVGPEITEAYDAGVKAGTIQPKPKG